jgi:2-(1,2-epoxy-1,2-dihydrophenyl)acetyl-CoA isomerase
MARLRGERDDSRFLELLTVGREVVTSLRSMPQPSIAAINGVAAGAGMSLALACDLRVAADDAKLIASFGRLGLHPDWGMTYTLPRLVGPARALELVLTAEPVDAEAALRMGLVNRVAPADGLLEAAHALANTLAARSPHAMTRVRETFHRSLEHDFDQVFEDEISAQLSCFMSEDLAEGVQAFLEKREPVFRGR